MKGKIVELAGTELSDTSVGEEGKGAEGEYERGYGKTDERGDKVGAAPPEREERGRDGDHEGNGRGCPVAGQPDGHQSDEHRRGQPDRRGRSMSISPAAG